MSYACSIQDCKKVSHMQCTCPKTLRFCKDHIGNHSFDAGCDIKNTSREVKEWETKLYRLKNFLTSEKSKIMEKAYQMTFEIKKMLDFGLRLIDDEQKMVNKIEREYNYKDLDGFDHEFYHSYFSKRDFINEISNPLTTRNFHCKTN